MKKFAVVLCLNAKGPKALYPRQSVKISTTTLVNQAVSLPLPGHWGKSKFIFICKREPSLAKFVNYYSRLFPVFHLSIEKRENRRPNLKPKGSYIERQWQ